MGVEQSTLDAFMDAVTNYYGGTDIWAGISDAGAFTSADFAAKVTQVDGVSAVYNHAGDVLYYKYNDQIVANALDISNTINSNAGSTIASQSVNIPANTTVGSGTTSVAVSSGMKAGGVSIPTVIKDVAIGAAAVGAGIQLGAIIDSTLYNLNPDFWDENNMSTLNPQTWDSLVSDYGDPAQSVFNMVFGINKNTNEVQGYLDERNFAYIAQYLMSKGAFSSGNTAEVDPSVMPSLPASNAPSSFYIGTQSIMCDAYTDRNLHNPIHYYATAYRDSVYNTIFTYDINGTEPPQTRGFHAVFAAEEPFDVYYSYGSTSGTASAVGYTVNGKQLYMLTPFSFTQTLYLFGSGYNIDNEYPYSGTMSLDWQKTLAYIMVYGSRTGSGVAGIDVQNDATIPRGINSDMTLDQVIAQLQAQYPDLFTDAITNDVVQPDGSVKTYTYLPVAIPENMPLDDVTNKLKPTGGTDLKQDQTSINPTTTPTAVIEELLKLIGSPNPTAPTQTPPKTPTDYPDTGDGNTPTVITPTGQASALYSIYNPTQMEINSLGSWLWSSDFVDQLLKLFNDPMQAIIGLHKVFATPPVSGTGPIKVGYLNSGVTAKLVSSQYTEINCGTVSLREYFGNVLDYTDTDIYIYLPFIGIVPVSTVDLMRASINIKYKVDVLTGACLAIVNVNRDNNAGGQLYCYSGNCAVQYPLSSGSYMGIVTGILGVAGAVAGTIASGGSLLPVAVGAGASALGHSKTQIQHSGNLSGNAGAMGIKKPYLIIRRPITKIATGFEVFNGVANNKTAPLSSYTGYTKVNYVHLENINATDNELDEIKAQLKNGVII